MKKLIYFVVALVCLCGCSDASEVYPEDTLIITKVTRVASDCYVYTVNSFMPSGAYEWGNIKIIDDCGKYNIGDTLYFTTKKVEE